MILPAPLQQAPRTGWFLKDSVLAQIFPLPALFETKIRGSTFLFPRSSGVPHCLSNVTYRATPSKDGGYWKAVRKDNRASYQEDRPTSQQADPHPMNPSSVQFGRASTGLPNSRRMNGKTSGTYERRI